MKALTVLTEILYSISKTLAYDIAAEPLKITNQHIQLTN